MSLAEKIQQAWQQQAKWLVLLRPLSWVYRVVFVWQRARQQKTAYKAAVPVMIIGNITVGGSGKTPLIIQLVNFLQQHQVRVGVISRGYGGQGPFPALVDSTALASEVGDEPRLIVDQTAVPMAVAADRKAAIELLLQHHHLDLILSDDGLQHFALQRDIEWVVVDSQRGFGNQKLLPEGFLREPLTRLETVTVIEHHAQARQPLHMYLKTGQIYNVYDKQQAFDPSCCYDAVVGIGFPQRFFASLDSLGINYQPRVYPDHHHYQLDDVRARLQRPIITTSKDAVKLQELCQAYPELLQQIWVLPVEAVLSEACYSKLINQLQSLNIRILP